MIPLNTWTTQVVYPDLRVVLEIVTVDPDPNPFPYFHLFGRRKPAQPPRCTGDPCICTNGIGCVTIPMELW